MTMHAFGDTAALLGRSLRHIGRSPDTIITTAVMPIAFMLLFVYVLGGAIEHRHATRLRHLPAARDPADHDRLGHRLHRLPAVPGPAERHLRAVPVDADRAVGGAVGACADLAGREPGLAGRWSCSSPLADGLPLGRGPTGLARGRRHPGAVHPGADLAGRHPRPDRQDAPTARARFSYPLIFLPFISSAFVPTAPMPGPVRWFAEHQPVTSIVNTIRALFAGQPRRATTSGSRSRWCVGLLVVAYARRCGLRAGLSTARSAEAG